MKLFVSILVISILCWLAELIMPWWAVAVVPFLVALFAGMRPGRSFIMGFSGVGLCWLVVSLFHDLPNDHILSTRMAALFHLPNYVLFMVVTVFIGALIGGMAASTGAILKGKTR